MRLQVQNGLWTEHLHVRYIRYLSGERRVGVSRVRFDRNQPDISRVPVRKVFMPLHSLIVLVLSTCSYAEILECRFLLFSSCGISIALSRVTLILASELVVCHITIPEHNLKQFHQCAIRFVCDQCRTHCHLTTTVKLRPHVCGRLLISANDRGRIDANATGTDSLVRRCHVAE